MEILLHLLQFLLATGFMWFSSELVIRSVEKLSKNVQVNSFIISFIILGILTSVTEISVGVNAIFFQKPEIFAGNLIGASFVILLLIIPLLAIFNRGIQFRKDFTVEKLLFFLILLIAPSFIVLDGIVSQYDAALLVLLYLFFFYFFRKHGKIASGLETEKINRKALFISFVKILGGAALIYFSSQILVDKTIYFAQLFNAPAFVVSLVVLSIGTNLPELAIAINSTIHKQPEIALGDYIGSASVNVLLFGIFTLINGSFSIDTNHFNMMLLVIVTGFILFFIFSKSKRRLSFFEGVILLMVYFVYLLLQGTEIIV